MNVFSNEKANNNLIDYRKGIIDTINKKKNKIKHTEELLDDLLNDSGVSIKK
jgi:hypothetical protein